MTISHITYSDDFKERDFVQKISKMWLEGQETFELKTSGSTGTPKLVELGRKLLIWSAESTKRALDKRSTLGKINDSDESILCCIPVTKTGGFMQLIRALHFGWHIHFVDPSSNPLETISGVHHYDQTSLTPFQLENILDSHKDEIGQFKSILIGGAAISLELLEKIKAFNEKRTTQFWETYGMTETASHIALKKIGYDKHFRPQSGVNLLLSENQLTIRIPELQFSIDTNDIARIHGDGFEIIGRADDVINSGGIKIHPTIIEPKIKSVFSSASINRNFYISSIPDKTYGQKVILVLEGEPLKNESFLLEAIKRELPSYHNPKSILYVDSINRTDTGKLIRKAY
ncbi:MAG: AMP-binding protein [Bacteroidia bacterium]